MTFTSGNWNTPQTVTVTGVDDDIIDGTMKSTITFEENAARTEKGFDAVANATVTATTAGGWFSTASVTIALHARCFATRSASSRT